MGIGQVLLNHFNPLLIALAVLACIVAVAIAVYVPQRFPTHDGRKALRLRMIAGTLFGFGAWSTHFIGALAHENSGAMVFSMPMILLSLGVSIALGCALAQTVQRDRISYHALRETIAAVVGMVGIHYAGMAGVQAPDPLVQSASQFGISLLVATIFSAMATWALRRNYMLLCGLSFSGGFIAMQYFALSAIADFHTRVVLTADAGIGTLEMGLGLGVVTILAATYCGTAIFFARRGALEMQDREKQFGLLAQGIKDTSICLLDPGGRIMTWNEGARRVKGYTAEEAIGMNFSRFYTEVDRELGVPQRALQIARETGSFAANGWRCRKNGTRFWSDVLIEPFFDDRGMLQGFAKITRDISERKAQDEQLRELARSLDAALSNMHQGLALIDENEKLVLANTRCEEVLGLAPGSLEPDITFRECVRLIIEARRGEALEDDILDEAVEHYRALFDRPGGGSITEEFSERCVVTVTHRVMAGGGWVLTVEDVTDRHRVEKRIHHMAMHDALTGLPNREAFRRALAERLDQIGENGGRIGLIIVDLDNFKDVNDSFGHAAGDAFLQQVAARMSDALMEGEFLARLGGDEFAAFKVLRRDAEADDFVHRLGRSMEGTVRCGEYELPYSGSLGFAEGPRDGASGEELCGAADLAMYRAKRSATERVCRYVSGMDDEVRARKHLAKELRGATDRNQLSLVYQAQWSVPDESIVGYEALLRWNHPELGEIPPTRFIEIAEENGEIVRIGEWVLQRACEDAAGWERPLRVSVNISPVQLVQNDLARMVMRALIVSGLPAERLELEITESALITDKLRALHNLRQIKALGVTIAIDDFGTGFSSLDTLNSFPFDKIKIDGSFLADLEKSHQSRSIIRSVLALGRSLEVPVLAEGVETQDQLEFLRRERCSEVQGYLFGRPMPVGGQSREAQPSAPAATMPDQQDRANWIV